MLDGSNTPEISPQKERTLPIKMAAETIAKNHPNQDCYFINAQRGIAGVFDGIGGHAGGAEASKIGSKTIEQSLIHRTPTSIEEAKRNIIEFLNNAHENILLNSQKPELKGMGTTGTVAQVLDNKDGSFTAVVGNIGDSRAYIFHDGKLEAVTIDDNRYTAGKSYEEARATQARLSNLVIDNSEEAHEYFATRNMISSSLGSKDGMTPNIYTVTLHAGDKLILTTDGVHDNLTDRDIEATMRAQTDHASAAKRLTENAKTISQMGKEAYLRSKPDDTTAVVIEIGLDSIKEKQVIPSQPSEKSEDEPIQEVKTVQDIRTEIKNIHEKQNQGLFGNAQSASDVLEILAGTNEVQGSKYTFGSEDLQRTFLDVISGTQQPLILTRSEGLREAALRILETNKMEKATISEAKSPEELVNILAGIKGIQGSKDWFSNWELISALRQVLAEKVSPNILPRAFGLRLKVEELLKSQAKLG